MFRYIAILAATLLVTAQAYAADDKVETIKVLIADGVSNPQVEVTGGYRVFNPATQKYIGASLRGRGGSVEALDTGLKWREEYPAVYQISIIPRRDNHTIIVNGVQYEGSIHVYQVDGKVSIVNEVPVEDYLRITLSETFPRSLDPEVMAAVAIAARTRAQYEVDQRRDAFWHVRAEEVGYRGGLASTSSRTIDRAVSDTEYMVLYLGERPGHTFPAVWTEDCAGRTGSYELMFGASVHDLRPVDSPLARQHREEAAWRVAVPKEWLARTARLDGINTMSLYADPESKKVYAVRFSDGQRIQDINFFTLQRAIGPDKLRSSDFTAEMSQGQVVFQGYGEGHGVGLCLFTAQKMANNGANAAEILQVFYPGSQLEITHEVDPKVARRRQQEQANQFGFSFGS
jgi:SpoIID/LytB domain protein